MFENFRNLSVSSVVCLPHATRIIRSGVLTMSIGGVRICSCAFAVSLSFRTAEIYRAHSAVSFLATRTMLFQGASLQGKIMEK